MLRALRLFRPAVQGLLIAMLVVAAAFVVVPESLGWPVQTVLTGSMEPGTPVGSAVVVQPVSADRIQPGHVITFAYKGHLVTHRVLEVQGDGAGRRFVTKGDANEDPDSDLVLASAVRGRVRLTVSHLGSIAHELRRPAGRFLLVATALMVLGISGLKRLLGAQSGTDPSPHPNPTRNEL